MEQQKRLRPRLGGAVYVLPNLLTSGNLFFGYFSIVKSTQGDFKWAAGAILLSGVFDVLDGRVAKLTNGMSEFGVQYDSLCDLVSFGLAPAIMMYHFGMNTLGRIGWIFCFIFLACGALRLARFNVQSSIGKTDGDFTGLPIPMAAGVIACFIGFLVELDKHDFLDVFIVRVLNNWLLKETTQRIILLCFAPLLGLLMVSNIAYRSHKSLSIDGVKAFRILAICVITLGLAAYMPLLVGFFLSIGYALSGPIELVLGWKKPAADDDIFQPAAGVDHQNGPED